MTVLESNFIIKEIQSQESQSHKVGYHKVENHEVSNHKVGNHKVGIKVHKESQIKVRIPKLEIQSKS